MAVRITPQVVTNRTINNIRRTNERVNLLQTQLQTGIRVQDPHDDPAAAGFISDQDAEDKRLSTNLENISTARFALNHGVDVLLNVAEQFREARVLLIDANSPDSHPEETAETVAREVDGILETVLDAANERAADGRALFGGTDSDDAPFVATRDANGRITSVSYQGSKTDSFARLTKQQEVPILLSGERVFQQREALGTRYSGVTGAAAGTGTDSSTGQGSLTVTRTAATTYGASGIVDSNSGGTLDTIAGSGHTLDVTVSAGVGTVQLNGGEAVTFNTAGELDVQVTGPDGETVFIDLPGGLTTQSIAVTAPSSVSANGGTAQTLTSGTLRLEGADGRTTHVNVDGIVQAGTDIVDYEGSYDVFEFLIAVRDSVQDLNRPTRGDDLTNHLGELDRLDRKIQRIVGEQSARAENIQTLETRVQDIQLHVRSVIADVKDADISEAILKLQNEENLFQLGLAVAARVNQLSLADFLS